MDTPANGTPARALDHGDAPAREKLNCEVVASIPPARGDIAAIDPLDDDALVRELDREREIMVAWLPRFDTSGRLIEETSGTCPWAGLCEAGRADLFHAALETLPTAHRTLLRRAYGSEPDARAAVRSARCRLAVHQALQAVLHLAHRLRDTRPSPP